MRAELCTTRNNGGKSRLGFLDEQRGDATDASRHALRQRVASDAHAVVMGPP